MQAVRRVVVTGSNKGIGYAIVKLILKNQDDTFAFLCSRNEQRGKDAMKKLLEENPGFKDRVEMLVMDTSNNDSVVASAKVVEDKYGKNCLYGVVNNAGLGFGPSMDDILAVNVYGVHNVCTAFLPLLKEDGRIVNISSGAAPMFVRGCSAENIAFCRDSTKKWADIDAFMKAAVKVYKDGGDQGKEKAKAAGYGMTMNGYGLSKAMLNSYTMYTAASNPKMTVNACSPGFIATDMTKNMNAAKTPEEGAYAPLELLFNKKVSGKFFGSDAKRSPLHVTRDPGTAEYASDDEEKAE